jgi:hypothetical protein
VSSGRPGITSYVAFRQQIGRLATLEHVDELRQLTGSFLGGYCLVQAMEDGVAVDAVEGGDEADGILVGVRGHLEVARELGVTLRSLGSIPAAVGLGALDVGKPGRLHAPLRHQGECAGAINLRPAAPGHAGRESDQEMVEIDIVQLAVDLAMAKCGGDCLLF